MEIPPRQKIIIEYTYMYSKISNQLGGVMVSMILVAHWFSPTNDYKIGICCLSVKEKEHRPVVFESR